MCSNHFCIGFPRWLPARKIVPRLFWCTKLLYSSLSQKHSFLHSWTLTFKFFLNIFSINFIQGRKNLVSASVSKVCRLLFSVFTWLRWSARPTLRPWPQKVPCSKSNESNPVCFLAMADKMRKDPGLNSNKQSPAADPYNSKLFGLSLAQ